MFVAGIVTKPGIHQASLHRGDAFEQLLAATFTTGLFESSGVRERSSLSRSDSARIRSVIEKARLRIAVVCVLQEAAGEPKIVGCPRRELLGAAVGIMLEASERLDGVDRGKRVSDGLRAGPALPTEPHAPVRAVGLRSRAVCPLGGIEGLELCSSSSFGAVS